MSLSFFKSYFPEITRMEFSQTSLTKQTIGEQNHRTLTELLINSTLCYLRQETRFALKCAAMINLLFDSLLEAIPCRLLDPQEMQIPNLRKGRVQRIEAYIEENYDQKLLLSDLARQEQLSMPHLSHFLTENFGMSFQDYLLRQRCQKAQKMLSSTDISLGDVSLACGFSSARYMDKGFRQKGTSLPGISGNSPAIRRRKAYQYSTISYQNISKMQNSPADNRRAVDIMKGYRISARMVIPVVITSWAFSLRRVPYSSSLCKPSGWQLEGSMPVT